MSAERSKRPLSPAPLPPPKRLHSPGGSHRSHQNQSTFDSLLYDELILVIFSYLPWADLCTVQRTNRNWARLALDNQLWKNLYLSEYGRPRLRGVRGFIGRADGREVRPLPGRARSEDVKDWKWMFRISSNWRTGRCSVENLHTGLDYSALHPPATSGQADNLLDEQTFLLLAGDMTISASSRPSTAPRITLASPAHETHTIRSPSARTSDPIRITALALDQSPPSTAHRIRLISFLSTGEFSIFNVDHHTPAHSSRLLTYVPTSRSTRTAPIIQAVYHHPLLVTLSKSFQLSLYDLSDDKVVHTQTLTSFTSHPPSSLVLSAPSPSTYKLVLAYAIPVYPSHWSVGATELLISSSVSMDVAARMTVAASRTTRAIDVPQGWIDENKLRLIREQWARKVARVADTQTDGKWVVLAPGDPLPASRAASPTLSASSSSSSLSPPPSSQSTFTSSSMHTASALQLYRLHLPASSSPTAVPKLTFVRSLHGQIGPVSALALADGRCVSLGVNGSIWVWDLEGGTGAEVSGGVEIESVEDGEHASWSEDERLRSAAAVKGTVVFDERRIISSDVDGVRVWRFDV
ncbi:uncharacterized protein B0H18DRAFT_1010472 [Fomitopsis serialis]|uniref:uncharacterized protein n=1 Tax=Fomitopsis serialis TaxID=139415 RepID=UPI002007324A|nr:uncharacterized protein B0H18DRAFT_1010472 [Neoantrodia serialis]KAH9924854.1 hypothetical protein B0H18DRAFT_1010472 [Neoantrodia serialis]